MQVYHKVRDPSHKTGKKSKIRQFLEIAQYFFSFRFTPCKAEQPLKGMDLQEKEAHKG